ncbi:hypothetical protein Leryth_012420 [Lithospermum erythrorhizon]|nr:hypothetical protein Leryth_012420 [Lithospermum erythrorhizon]
MEKPDDYQQQLDIDSLLLTTTSSSDDDDDVTNHPSPRQHRTVDEILLHHSSPPPSPPPSLLLHTQSLDISKLNYSSNNNNNSVISRVSSSSEVASANSNVSGRVWFSGVRSNAKPGAALAAAAAASRSIPRRRIVSSVNSDGGSDSIEGEVIMDESGNRSWIDQVYRDNVSDDGVGPGILIDPVYRGSAGDDRIGPGILIDQVIDPVYRGSVGDDRIGPGILIDQVYLDNVSNDRVGQGISIDQVYRDNVSNDRIGPGILVEEVVDGGGDERLGVGATLGEDQSDLSSRGLLGDNVPVENDDLRKMESSIEPDLELRYYDGKTSIKLDENPPVGSTVEFQSMESGGEIEGDELNLIEENDSRKEVQLKSSEIPDEVKMSDMDIGLESNELEEGLVTRSDDREDGDVGGDESTSNNDVVDMAEELSLQWESRRGTKTSQKRRESSLKLLELAEELEKKQAFTGLHWEEGAAALPMRLEGVRRGSDVLGYFDIDAHNFITQTIASEAFRRDHGSPQVLAVHFNYIAIGTSRGGVVVVSSKYTPHHADKMDTKMLILGLQGNRSHAPVTSMCFNQQGDLLFAGYGDGHYTVWDVQRASALKVITEHKAPVVHMLYLGQNNVVSGDTKGVVKLIHFSVVPLLNRISYSAPTKLLDETTSTVVCAVPLISSEIHSGTSVPSQGSNAVSTGGLSSRMGGVVGGDSGWKLFDGSSTIEEGVVIFVTHQSALVAKLNPSIEVYAQLPKPDGVRDGAMPYAAWKYMVVSEEVSSETSGRVALLAIAWDRKVQVAKLVKSELKVYEKWDLVAPAVGVVWLSDQLLVVLTSIGQMCLFSRYGNLIHQTSFAMDGSLSDDLISSHTYFVDKLGNSEKAHHNCVMVRGAKIYILGSMHLAVSRLLPWRERIEVLQRAGDWMGALYMAMTFYDGQAQAVIDLPRNLNDVQKTVMPYLLQLLFSYVDEVFSYISVACGKQDKRPDPSVEHYDECDSEESEAKEQYSRVGGVAVEFCIHINRTDILFDEIYSRFGKIKHQETFLELLEPYILKDMLGSLPPEIMQALVEHYSRRGWLQRVEQCVLHMDILSLDFNQVVRLCREHRLHGALIYLFNKGLDDFKTPLEELLVVLQDSPIASVPTLGYRILIYLKYCFQGMAFPPGHGNIPPARLPSLRNEIVQFLLESSSGPSSWSVSNISFDEGSTYLHHLLEFDTGSTLDVLKLAFVEDESLDTKDLSLDSVNSDGMLTEDDDDLVSQNHELVQKLIDVLSDILGMSYFQTSDSTDGDNSKPVEIWPSKNDVKHVFDFVASYIACKRVKVEKAILNQIVEYLTSEINSSPVLPQQNHEVLKKREMQLLALLEAIPVSEWDAPYFLHLCAKAQFHQACGLINAIGHHYSAALDCYMNVMEEPIHAFSFIHDMLPKLSDNQSENIESAVISRIQHLVRLSREGTFFMVLYHFPAKTEQILSELHSHPESLLLYLKTVFEVHTNGSLDFAHLKKCERHELHCGKGARLQSDRIEAFLNGLLDFPNLVRSNTIQITDEITELYLELLCRYERESVLKFLETFESYRVDRCLRLCQEFGIVDAAAFLLERVGDVGSALLLHLSDLNHKFVMLGAAFDSESPNGDMTNFDRILKKKEVHDILDTVRACVELCQRNSPRLDPHEAEFLWFQLLDSLEMFQVSREEVLLNSSS